MKRLLFLSFCLTITIGFSQSCENLKTTFESYPEAKSIVTKTNFNISEELDTSKSSWLRSASYFSCDKQTGYLIIYTDKKSYIHANVPLRTWQSFKNAESFGSFYSKNIRGNYKLKLN